METSLCNAIASPYHLPISPISPSHPDLISAVLSSPLPLPCVMSPPCAMNPGMILASLGETSPITVTSEASKRHVEPPWSANNQGKRNLFNSWKRIKHPWLQSQSRPWRGCQELVKCWVSVQRDLWKPLEGRSHAKAFNFHWECVQIFCRNWWNWCWLILMKHLFTNKSWPGDLCHTHFQAAPGSF